MNHNELISIVIPIYNGEKHIKDCLESLINQTYHNLEIITVIDGATDNSLKICKQYQERDNRIKIFERENKGVQDSRRYGVENSKGTSVFFVDADDWIDLNTIEVLQKYREKFSADIVRVNYKEEMHFKENKINKETEKTCCIYKKEFKQKVYCKIIDRIKFVNIWGQLISKKIITDAMFDSSMIIGEDLDFNVKLYDKSESVITIENAYYHYRKNKDSITHKPISDTGLLERKSNSLYKAYINLLEYSKNWGMDEKDEKRIVLHFLNGMSELICDFLIGAKYRDFQTEKELDTLMNRYELKQLAEKLEKKEIRECNLKYKKVIQYLKTKNIKKIRIYAKIQYQFERDIKRILMKTMEIK